MKEETKTGATANGNVIDPDTGEYLATSFSGENGVWKLIGTESGQYIKSKPGARWPETSLGQTMDEFRGPDGKYLKAKRKSVFAMQVDNKIKPI